jgi:hypothetical protein
MKKALAKGHPRPGMLFHNPALIAKLSVAK